MARDVEAVILAAGLSSRCPQYKMALPLGAHSVIERTVEGLSAFVDRVLVVVGWREETVRELLARHAKVEFVPNPDYALGMFSSVRAGAAAVRAARFFLQPGDMPLVGESVYKQLLLVPGDVVIPTFRGRKGHPVLMRRQVAHDIVAAPADATLRDILAVRGFVPVAVEEEGILLDIDTLEDYQEIARRYHAQQPR